MADHNRKIKQQNLKSTFQQIEKIHPHKLLLYIFIFGSAMIFSIMLLGYSVTNPGVVKPELPKSFIISALIMLTSAFIVSKTLQSFEKEKIYEVRNYLILTLTIAAAFTVCQYSGWRELSEAGIFVENDPSATYLYIIAGMHMALFIGAIVFLLIILAEAIKIGRDPVKTLIATTNPYEKTKLEIFNNYWQFLNLIWLSLFTYFLFSL